MSDLKKAIEKNTFKKGDVVYCIKTDKKGIKLELYKKYIISTNNIGWVGLTEYPNMYFPFECFVGEVEFRKMKLNKIING